MNTAAQLTKLQGKLAAANADYAAAHEAYRIAFAGKSDADMGELMRRRDKAKARIETLEADIADITDGELTPCSLAGTEPFPSVYRALTNPEPRS